MTITATSESDPSQSSTVEMWVGSAEGLTDATGDLVAGMDLHAGAAAPLDAKLGQIARRLGGPAAASACTALDSFLDTVDAREGARFGLSSDEADELRSIASSLGMASGCST